MALFDQARGAFAGMLNKDKGNSVVGFDIGSSSIKVVQLRKEGERAVLETYGTLALGPYGGLAFGEVPKLGLDQVVEALQVLIKESNVSTKTGSIAIPVGSTLMTLIDTPKADEKELQKIVPREAQKYIPVSLSEVALDWWVMPKIDSEGTPAESASQENNAETNTTMKVLIAAVHNDVLVKYNSIIGQLGLENSTLEIEGFSITRATLAHDMSSFIIFDLGSATTKLSIVHHGIIQATHILNYGSRDITSAVAEFKKVTTGKAEEIKRNIGLLGVGGDESISRTMKEVVLQILDEANGILLNYQKRYHRSVSSVVLVGGGVLLRGFTEVAKEKLASEVIYADVFEKVESPSFIKPVLKETGPEFAVSLGLALSRLKEM